jgi:hypothetical protein
MSITQAAGVGNAIFGGLSTISNWVSQIHPIDAEAPHHVGSTKICIGDNSTLGIQSALFLCHR